MVVQGGTSKVEPIFEEIGQQLITLPQGGDDMLTVYWLSGGRRQYNARDHQPDGYYYTTNALTLSVSWFFAEFLLGPKVKRSTTTTTVEGKQQWASF